MLHNEVTREKVSNMQKPDRDDSLKTPPVWRN